MCTSHTRLPFLRIGNLCLPYASFVCLRDLSNVYIKIMIFWELGYDCEASVALFFSSFSSIWKMCICLHDVSSYDFIKKGLKGSKSMSSDFQLFPIASTCVRDLNIRIWKAWWDLRIPQPLYWSHLSGNNDLYLAWFGKIQVKELYLFNPQPSFICEDCLIRRKIYGPINFE